MKSELVRSWALSKAVKPSKINFSFATFTLTCIGLLGGIGRYGYYDDYSTLIKKSENYPGQFQLWLETSRPLGQLILRTLWIPADSIDDLIYLHVMGVILAGFFSVLVYLYFVRKVDNSVKVVMVASASVLLSSGIILIASWPQNNYGIVALIISTTACLLFDSSRTKKSILLTSVLSTASFLTYQPSAMLLILLPSVRYILQVVQAEEKELKVNHFVEFKWISNHYLILLFSGLLALSVFKFAGRGSPTTLRTTLIGPFDAKIDFLFRQAIPTQFNFQRTPWDTLPILGFICLGVITTALIVLSSQSKSAFPFLSFMAAAISSLAPNFLTAENWASSRSLLQGQWLYASLTLTGVIYLLSFIPKYSRVLTTLFSVGLITFSIVQSNQTLNRELRTPQLKELNAARLAVSKLDPNLPIFVMKSSWTSSLAPWVRADEFGIPSTAGAWVPVPLTKLILKELHGENEYDVQLVDETSNSNQINYLKLLEQIKEK
jgi:hypothetical protein